MKINKWDAISIGIAAPIVILNLGMAYKELTAKLPSRLAGPVRGDKRKVVDVDWNGDRIDP